MIDWIDYKRYQSNNINDENWIDFISKYKTIHLNKRYYCLFRKSKKYAFDALFIKAFTISGYIYCVTYI